jgi:hypothetical protein
MSNLNLPAWARTTIYALTCICAVGLTVGNAFGLIPSDAIERGVSTGTQILTILSAVLALRNITPDE